MERMFYCVEDEGIYTLSEIRELYNSAVEDGDTYQTESFEDYLNASCVEGGGSLVEIKIESTVYLKGRALVTVWNVKSDLY